MKNSKLLIEVPSSRSRRSPLTIKMSGSPKYRMCLVWSFQRYMETRPLMLCNQLYVTSEPKALAVSDVTSLLQQLGKLAGFEGLGTHSFWIGWTNWAVPTANLSNWQVTFGCLSAIDPSPHHGWVYVRNMSGTHDWEGLPKCDFFTSCCALDNNNENKQNLGCKQASRQQKIRLKY